MLYPQVLVIEVVSIQAHEHDDKQRIRALLHLRVNINYMKGRRGESRY